MGWCAVQHGKLYAGTALHCLASRADFNQASKPRRNSKRIQVDSSIEFSMKVDDNYKAEMVPNPIWAPEFCGLQEIWSPRNLSPKKFGPLKFTILLYLKLMTQKKDFG